MKDFLKKHKIILIIAGVILAVVIGLLIYGLLASDNSMKNVKYKWTGEEVYVGDLGTDSSLPARVYLTADGDIRIDAYKDAAEMELRCDEAILHVNRTVLTELFNSQEDYVSSRIISFKQALNKGITRYVTEEFTETEQTEAIEQTQKESNVEEAQEIVPLESVDINAEDAEELKAEAFDMETDKAYYKDLSERIFGISLPYTCSFQLVAAGYGIVYDFRIVIDELGHLNIISIETKAIDVDYSGVENYDEIISEFPDLTIAPGLVVESAYEDYESDASGDSSFPVQCFEVKDIELDGIIRVLMVKKTNASALGKMLEEYADEKGPIDVNGHEGTIYDAQNELMVLVEINGNSYLICGYKEDELESGVAKFFK